jgi:UDP-glucose 4,6-dehydratase
MIGEVYNIGTSKERSVLQVAHDVCAHFGLNAGGVLEHTTDRLFNDRRYFIDETKLQALGWEPRVSWADGLKLTIDWYLKNVVDGSYWPSYEVALTAHPVPCVSPAATPRAFGSSHALAPAAKPDAPVFLVYGRNGWIGGLLGELLQAQGAQWSFGAARLEDRGAILADIRRVKPTHVMNAAGVTGRPNVDWCESHKLETIQTNVIGILNLVDVCRIQELHVTNFATGCIYSYDEAHKLGSGVGFTESDPPNFDGSYYSKTKGMVEQLLGEYDNLLQLRLRMPISHDLANGRNFVKKIVNYAKVVDIPNSMTVLDEFIPISVEMARRSLKGIYNFTNPGVISHNEVLSLYRDYVDPSYTWSNFSEEEQAKVRIRR